MITLKQLSFAYKKGNPVLDNINMKLLPGHIYGLLGRNGAGKSSLLYNLCGLLFPKSGQCRVLDHVPSERRPGFLQQVYLLPEVFSVPDVTIDRYLRIHAPFYPVFDEASFWHYLSVFDIAPGAELRKISFGQQKKMMISFALSTHAKLLLMDEPTNGLDIPSKRQFRKVMAGALQPDQLFIISTHQVRDLDSLIDEVLILDERRILLQESVESITGKLAFHQVMDPAEVTHPLFSEGALKGYAVVARNEGQEHTRLDMEMFFNAVLAEKQQILPLFNR